MNRPSFRRSNNDQTWEMRRLTVKTRSSNRYRKNIGTIKIRNFTSFSLLRLNPNRVAFSGFFPIPAALRIKSIPKDYSARVVDTYRGGPSRRIKLHGTCLNHNSLHFITFNRPDQRAETGGIVIGITPPNQEEVHRQQGMEGEGAIFMAGLIRASVLLCP